MGTQHKRVTAASRIMQVGNHDVGDFHPHEEYAGKWSQRVRRFEETLGAANRVVRVRGVSFVLLNTIALTAPDEPPHAQRRAVMDVVASAANESASSICLRRLFAAHAHVGPCVGPGSELATIRVPGPARLGAELALNPTCQVAVHGSGANTCSEAWAGRREAIPRAFSLGQTRHSATHTRVALGGFGGGGRVLALPLRVSQAKHHHPSYSSTCLCFAATTPSVTGATTPCARRGMSAARAPRKTPSPTPSALTCCRRRPPACS